jgi:hypothetical protein
MPDCNDPEFTSALIGFVRGTEPPCPEALAVLDTARAIAIALVRDGVRYNAGLELAHHDAIERWGRLIVRGERIVKVPDA